MTKIKRFLLVAAVGFSTSITCANTCIVETARLAKAPMPLNSVLHEFADLIVDYATTASDSALSEVRLSVLRTKSAAIENLLTEARYNDAQRQLFNMQIKKIVETLSSGDLQQQEREQLIETEARKLESDILIPFKEDADSDFAKNFSRAFRGKMVGHESKISTTGDGQHFVIFQTKMAIIFDAKTGQPLRELNSSQFDSFNFSQIKFSLSADGFNVIFGDDNTLYSASITDLLNEPSYKIDIDQPKNLWWQNPELPDSKLKGFYPLNKDQLLRLSSNYDFNDTKIITLGAKVTMTAAGSTFTVRQKTFTPLSRPQGRNFGTLASNKKVFTPFDESLLGIYTHGSNINNCFLSIFDLPTKTYQGRLVLGSALKEHVEEYYFNTPNRKVVGTARSGLAFWSLHQLGINTETTPEAFLPFENGKVAAHMGPKTANTALSRDGKYALVVTVKGTHYSIEIYQIDDTPIGPFRVQTISLDRPDHEWRTVGGVAFSPDSKSIIVVQDGAEPIIFKTNL